MSAGCRVMIPRGLFQKKQTAIVRRQHSQGMEQNIINTKIVLAVMHAYKGYSIFDRKGSGLLYPIIQQFPSSP